MLRILLPGGNTGLVEYGLYSPAPKAVAFARQHRNTPVLRKAKTISDKMVDKQLGWAMQRIGMMTPNNISVSYRIRW